MPQFRSTYTGRYSGIGRMLQRPWLNKPCRDAAVKLMHLAEAAAPVGDPEEDRHPGLYKASFHVVPIWKNVPFRGRPRHRPGAMVVNTAPHAQAVEYGDWDVPRYAPLSKAFLTLKAANRGRS
ncbi:hypothetical protein ACFUGD_01440 [Streptomyces sp. NPDC057217]|uniref:hypothetical protein n=1 Tax=Streptomyces sp. NPDC057217 TaxID=3346054 RepID=UPI00363D238F